MRTKTLLLTAALSAAGVATSMAQTAVYSVNIVGYINKTLPPSPSNLSLIANQLNATPDNTVPTLFGNPSGGVTVSKFNSATGNYALGIYDPDAGGWSFPGGMISLNPGEAAFVDNSTGAPLPLTFVGEVQLTSTVNIHHGIDGYSSVIPQAGDLNALGFPALSSGLTLYKFNTGSKGFDPFIFDPDAGGWNPSVPTVAIAEGFFIDNPGTTIPWSRSFSVGP